MWIATDSESIYPILIEIETPQKQWFYGSRAEIHSDFTHAQGQLAEWRAWFKRGSNRSAFLEYYGLSTLLWGGQRSLKPRFVLIHGRRSNYEGDQLRLYKRAELRREDERLMSFDRLTPSRDAAFYACVKKDQHGYLALCVPPTFAMHSVDDRYSPIRGWNEAVDDCRDMALARREYLKQEIGKITMQEQERLRFQQARLR